MGYDAAGYEGIDAQRKEYMYKRLIAARPDFANRADLMYDASQVELEYFRGLNDGSIKDPTQRKIINVVDYGAVGDNFTLNDTAFAAAFAAATISASAPLPIYFPSGTYRVAGTMDWRLDLLTVYGEPGQSVITQMTDNTPIMHVGGTRITVQGLYFRYNATQPAANTNAVALQISDSTRGRFADLEFYKTYSAIAIPQAIWRGPQNCVYSCIFENISSNAASGWHIDLTAYLGGNTGSILSNIYMKNLPGASKTAGLGGIHLKVCSEMVLQQINVEHGGYLAPIQLESVDGCTFDGVHFEGVQPDVYGASANNNAFFNCTSSSLAVKNVTWYNNIIDATLGITLYAMFRFNGVCKLEATELKESGTTLNGSPAWRRLYTTSGTTGSTAAFGIITKASTLADAIQSGTETSAPIVQKDSRRLAQPNLSIGADLAVGATVGFAYMPRIAGTPTGIPSVETGGVPFAIDTANSKIWVYTGAAWKSVTLA